MRPLITAIMLLTSITIWAQSANPQDGGQEFSNLPRGFVSLELGADYDTIYALLQSEPLFNFRGAPDVSIRPFNNEPIIQSGGNGYVESGIFQFHDDALYTITLRLDSSQMDYFTMFTTLSNRYGDPVSLNPQSARWEQGSLRMVLERPVVVKYIDLDVFNAIREAGAQEESVREFSRELFLDNF